MLCSLVTGPYQDAWVPLEESYAGFKHRMLQHSIDNPPEGAVKLFSMHEVQAITKFVGETYVVCLCVCVCDLMTAAVGLYL